MQLNNVCEFFGNKAFKRNKMIVFKIKTHARQNRYNLC